MEAPVAMAAVVVYVAVSVAGIMNLSVQPTIFSSLYDSIATTPQYKSVSRCDKPMPHTNTHSLEEKTSCQ
jgi:hypothetical protein